MSYTNNASKKVADFIIGNIQDGTWVAGDRIWSESELCQKLDVSRIAVRDAISSLTAKSVLKRVKGSGTYIESSENVSLEGIRYFKLENKDTMALMELRYIMDSYCTKLFARRASDEEIAKLEKCFQQMIKNRHDIERYDYFANEFHLLIARGSKNHFIIKVMKYLQDSLLQHQNILSNDLQKTKYQIGISYHYKMLQAIKRHDAEMAGAYCRYHIRLTMNIYKDINKNSDSKTKTPEK